MSPIPSRAKVEVERVKGPIEGVRRTGKVAVQTMQGEMMKRIMAVTALAGFLAATGCASRDQGGTSDQSTTYNSGSSSTSDSMSETSTTNQWNSNAINTNSSGFNTNSPTGLDQGGTSDSTDSTSGAGSSTNSNSDLNSDLNSSDSSGASGSDTTDPGSKE